MSPTAPLSDGTRLPRQGRSDRSGVALVVALVAMIAGGLAGAWSAGGADQAAVGVPASPAVLATPRSVACAAEPRSFAELRALVRKAEAAPPPARTPGPVPSGPPAGPGAAAAVATTVEELLACFATGEPLRVWGLYSDAYLARLLYRQRGFDRALYDAYATPRPAEPDERVVLRAIGDVVRLDDGRIGATVVLFYPGIGMEKRFFFAFVEEGGRWLIDDVVGEITFAVP